jgi:glycosyltransferase involved in cell wall biosynthesis
MKCIFIHQNFPGQFRHVAAALANDPGNEIVALGETQRLKSRPPLHPRIRTLGYTPLKSEKVATHHYLRDYEAHIRRGQAIARVALELRKGGFSPEVIVAHPGWGEALFLPDVFPRARIVLHCEYYYQATGGDVDFDPEFPAGLDTALKARIRNSTQLVSLVSADQGVSPTSWQRSRYPTELQQKIRTIHEGIDTTLVVPNFEATLTIAGHHFSPGDEVITYVGRNLEPYRGFHIFMRSLPELLRRRPKARVLMVGGDDVSYGLRLPDGETYRKRYMGELANRVDWSRVVFTGNLPYETYLKVLQISSCHVYLTYPFVLSWSILEAMSASCLVVASNTAPVQEVIRDGENGHLVDFFDVEALVHKVCTSLEDIEGSRFIRERARSTVVSQFDLTKKCLPEWLALLKQEAKG